VTPSATNPIDDPTFFVREHYRDFLNRDPDAPGLAFWLGQITACGSDQQCINNKRLDVSAAFFNSTEFQDTGSFVYRLYKASFGLKPTYTQFVTDRSECAGKSEHKCGEAGAGEHIRWAKWVYNGISNKPKRVSVYRCAAADGAELDGSGSIGKEGRVERGVSEWQQPDK